MNIVKKSSIAAVLGLLTFSLFASNVAKAETNPFAANELVTISAEHTDTKCGEGKAKDGKKGKCGEGKMKDHKKGKCGEGKLHAAKQGKCGEGKMNAAKEGKCGEGKMKAAKKGKSGEGKGGEGKMKDKSKKCGG